MLSSITIAIEDPVDDNSTRNKVDDKPLTNRDCFSRILLLFTNGLSQYNSEVHGFFFAYKSMKDLTPTVNKNIEFSSTGNKIVTE